MDPRTRTFQLVMLATDPGTGEHEARNAALSACKLIREHRLLSTVAPTVRGRRVTVTMETIDEALSVILQGAQEAMRADAKRRGR